MQLVSVIVLALFMGTTAYAQGNDNEAKLIGTWILDYSKTLSEIKQEAKNHYDKLSPNRKQGIEDSFSQRKMTFSSDGNYTLVVNASRQVSGSWNLKDDDTLEITIENRTIVQSISNISNNNLELELEQDNASKRLFDTWYLDKISN